MAEQDNLKTVQEVYNAFGWGDIIAVLNLLADDVEWVFHGPPSLPFAGRYHGREEVAKFFQAVVSSVEIEQFGPEEFIAQGDKVVVLGHERTRARPTGRLFEIDWVHVYTLKDGKIAQIREFGDTASVVEAFTP